MHPYTCERCNEAKTCQINGCRGDCAKVCIKCIRRGAVGHARLWASLALLLLTGCASPVAERVERENAARYQYDHSAADRAANPKGAR